MRLVSISFMVVISVIFSMGCMKERLHDWLVMDIFMMDILVVLIMIPLPHRVRIMCGLMVVVMCLNVFLGLIVMGVLMDVLSVVGLQVSTFMMSLVTREVAVLTLVWAMFPVLLCYSHSSDCKNHVRRSHSNRLILFILIII